MESITSTSQRQESYPNSGPGGLTSQQLRQVPSFNCRRAALAETMVRNQPVVDGPTPLTVSHIPQGPLKSTTNCVRVIVLADDSELPKCKNVRCENKATYSLGDKNVIVCSRHRKGQHVKRYAKYASRYYCHCGARATYKDGCQVPKYCYWHKTATSETGYKFQRFSMHYRGQFVGSYTLPKGDMSGFEP